MSSLLLISIPLQNNPDDVISATHTTLFAANVITGANMSAMLMYLTSMPVSNVELEDKRIL